MAELIRLGAYRRGSDPNVDEAIRLYPDINKFLAQDKDENTSIEQGFQILADILGMQDLTPSSEDEIVDKALGRAAGKMNEGQDNG